VGTERERLSDAESDFQATSEDVAADAARLRSIEEEKARLDPDDPRRAELSEEAALLAEAIRRKTSVELELESEIEEMERS
jgi:hypothetical protein